MSDNATSEKYIQISDFLLHIMKNPDLFMEAWNTEEIDE
tara:strand:+ start:782 stop:898 length:117 start_codon:yes stop_codon:yes gene_type:complete